MRHTTVALPSGNADPAAAGDLAADTASINSAARAPGGRVTVVAHAHGGAPTTNADFGPEGVHLACLGAFMPASGRAVLSYLPPRPLPPYVTSGEDGISRSVPGMVGEHCHADCTAADAAWAGACLVPQKAVVAGTPGGRAAWERIRSTCIVLTEDRAIHPPLQRVFAARATRTVEMASSHSSFLSRHAELAALLAGIVREAAAA